MIIAFEGLFCAGKTTIIESLQKMFFDAIVVPWDNDQLTTGTIRRLKQEGKLTDKDLYLLMQLVEFTNTYERCIFPHIYDDSLILCDRYYYTQIARHVARGGVYTEIEYLYERFVEPDLIIYMNVSPETSLSRIKNRGKMSNRVWTVGMNVALDRDEFNEDMYLSHLYQLKSSYEQIFDGKTNCISVDASKNKEELLSEVINEINRKRNEKETNSYCV